MSTKTKKTRTTKTPKSPGREDASARTSRLRKAALAEINARIEGEPTDAEAAATATSQPAAPASNAPTKPKRRSALDAAAEVLANAPGPMRAKELIAEMHTQGLWSSPGGQTPEATLYAAIIREIAAKGENARFVKLERGLFAARSR